MFEIYLYTYVVFFQWNIAQHVFCIIVLQLKQLEHIDSQWHPHLYANNRKLLSGKLR